MKNSTANQSNNTPRWVKLTWMGGISALLVAGAIVVGVRMGKGITDGKITITSSASSTASDGEDERETPSIRAGTVTKRPSRPPSVSLRPTLMDTNAPIATDIPTSFASAGPSMIPSSMPFIFPSAVPSAMPSIAPSLLPSQDPSELPSRLPTTTPSLTPTTSPAPTKSQAPSAFPTGQPSRRPTRSPAPSVSPAPSTFPTTSPAPTISKNPSHIPTGSPTATFSPTFFDVASDRTFRLKIHWEDGYLWQDEAQEQFWCLSCCRCDELNFSEYPDEVGCIDSPECQIGDQVWLSQCDRGGVTINTRNVADGVMLEFTNRGTCITRIKRDFLSVQACNETSQTQKWRPIANELPFELIPRYESRNDDGDQFCITQHHHPKEHEILGMKRCQEPREVHTSLYGIFPAL